jgi:putative membrane protein
VRSIACVALTAFLLASGGASAGDKITTAEPARSTSQEEAAAAFAATASLMGLFDVQSSELALDRANNADVRKLAREIVEEQTLANSRLRAFSPKYARIKLEGEYAARLDRLKQVKAEAFDAAFLTAQKESHDRSVALLSDYAQSGADPMLKSYASETLTFLTLHKTRIESLR